MRACTLSEPSGFSWPVEAETLVRSPLKSNVPSNFHGPLSLVADTVALRSFTVRTVAVEASRTSTEPLVIRTFSSLTCVEPNDVCGRMAQSTTPLRSILTDAVGFSSRMSKMRISPRRNGASSASIENLSMVMTGADPGSPTLTSEKVTDGNGRSLALAVPATVTGRPRSADASRSNEER
eukprot:gene25318-biopygen21847